MGHPESPAELYLAIQDGDTVRCDRCGRVVDFRRACVLLRGTDGRVRVRDCGACHCDFDDLVGALVSLLGAERASEEIRRIVERTIGDKLNADTSELPQ